MAFCKNEDIRGIFLGEEDDDTELVCRECMTQQEWDTLAQDKIIYDVVVRKSKDAAFYLCDRCNKRLTAA